MSPLPHPPALPAPGRHEARLALRVGDRSHLTLDIAITSGGLLAIGALVSMILLSTATIVATARR